MRQIVESSGDIVSLSATIIVSTFAHPRAPEVEPQYGESPRVKRLRNSKYNLVMKRAAEEWMGMADERHATRIITRDSPKERFEAPGGSIDEESAMKDVAHAREYGSVTKDGPVRKSAVQPSAAPSRIANYRIIDLAPEIWEITRMICFDINHIQRVICPGI
jgi:hypothetical protein